ncbi:hypothetical protein M413DRAFT_447469 [Hebeloma cylindrosporum]|uniref:Uncharacterized protein n=1 Tax=Hebeloma cylindrosporum TaxID=76867 RepID=A0A0C3BR67_HEBCY|nr:hypothetical protein M413DRAFT_447469 [Hebeloma cylindrosporum h7]
MVHRGAGSTEQEFQILSRFLLEGIGILWVLLSITKPLNQPTVFTVVSSRVPTLHAHLTLRHGLELGIVQARMDRIEEPQSPS